MADYKFTTSGGEEIPIIINTRRGLRNITLRPKIDGVHRIEISKPWLATEASALRFVEQKRRWLEGIFARSPVKQKLKDGDSFDFLGRRVVISRMPSLRITRLEIRDDGTGVLFVGGDDKLFENRIRVFVKNELLKEIKKLVRQTPREFWPSRISLRDTTSRWGSCSSTGTISFSWRLAFAPFDVMRYVVMHELSHRKHMDHSPEFWAQVRELYGFGVERAKIWLAKNGASLHRYL